MGADPCKGIIVSMTKILGAICLLSMTMFGASIYDYTMKSIDGQQVPLSAYKGKVVLLVNVASKCGFTPQYTGLEAMYEKYKAQGFVILGFPANNFMAQEPGTDAEIKTFCSTKYNVSFPMFSKVSVKGDDKADLYKYLTDQTANPATGGEIKWNFTKFLIDRKGKIIQRFEPATAPEKFDAAVADAVK